MPTKHELEGSCHCKNIQYVLKTSIPISGFTTRKCDCTFCRKQGGRYISDPDGELEYTINHPESLFIYSFGTKTAEFLMCKNCGVLPFITSRINDKTYAVINSNTLDQTDEFNKHSKVVKYDNEAVEQRLLRRKKYWIGTVTLIK